MTEEKIARAELRELKPGGKGEEGRHRVTVQFNPETLKVTYANQVIPPKTEGVKEQRGTDGIQFVGKGTTQLAVQLWFDISALVPGTGDKAVSDVRELTKDVIYFITPQKSEKDQTKYVPPGVRFLWGSFQFDGIVDSMEESLEFFSSDGRPLRASISMGLTQQDIGALRNEKFTPTAGGLGGRMTPGTRPLAQAASGSTIQGMASGRGMGANWQDIAAANGIENPRMLQPGRFIDLNAAKPKF